MLKSNLAIAIVRSSISELSSMGQFSALAIKDVLSKHYKRVDIVIINQRADLSALVSSRPDLVFLGMEFIPTNPELGIDDLDKIWLADYLESNNIAHTGSSYLAYQLGRDKHLAKQRVLSSGLKTAPFMVIKRDQVITQNELSLNFPLFIKPLNRGGGLGIDASSVVTDFSQLLSKTKSIANEYHSDSLIEEYLPGREFSVAILKDDPIDDNNHYSVMPIELIAPLNAHGSRILSSEVKSANAEAAIAVDDEVLKAHVSELALNVFQALGASDYGRIDIRLDRFNVAHFLEVNLIPSLISGYGSFPKACVLNIGMNYEAMMLRIVKLGLAHNLLAIAEPIHQTILNIIPAPAQ